MIIGINGKISSGKDTVAKIIQYLTCKHGQDGTRTFEESRDKIGNDGLGYSDFTNYNSPWEVRKFAYKLKQICSILTGIPVEDFEKQEVKDRFLGPEWKRYYVILKETATIIETDSSWMRAQEKRALAHIKRNSGRTSEIEIDVVEHTPTVRWLLQQCGTEALRNNIHENVWVNALFADYNNGRRWIMENANEKIDTTNKWILSDLRFANEMKAVKDRGGITIRVTRPGTAVGTHASETSLDNAIFDYEIHNDGSLGELVDKVREILKKEKII